LSKLTITTANNPESYYNGVNSAAPQPYRMFANVCGNADIGCEPISASCQETEGGDYYGCGILTTQNFTVYIDPATKKEEPNKGVFLNYYQGEICNLQSGNVPRQTTLVITCNPSTQTFSKPVITEPTSCHYFISFNSKFACPTGHLEGKDLGGWIFVILVLVGFALYFIIGIIIKIVVYKATGKEIIPNSEFWSDLPSLMKDGAVYLFNKITCRSGSYGKV